MLKAITGEKVRRFYFDSDRGVKGLEFCIKCQLANDSGQEAVWHIYFDQKYEIDEFVNKYLDKEVHEDLVFDEFEGIEYFEDMVDISYAIMDGRLDGSQLIDLEGVSSNPIHIFVEHLIEEQVEEVLTPSKKSENG